MKRIIVILGLFLTTVTSGQFNKDKHYTYQELNQLLELARSNNDNETLSEVYIKLGDYEGDVFAEYDKSLRYYNYALEHFKVAKNEDGIQRANHAIANRYRDAGFYREAVQILLKLAPVYENENKTRQLAKAWFDLSLAYKGLNEHAIAIEYLDKAIQLNQQQLNDTLLTIQILFNKILSFEQSFELDSALQTATQIFDLSSSMTQEEYAARSLFHVGYVNKLYKDYPKAEKYLNKSLEILPYSPYSDLRKLIYKELSDVYSKTKQSDAAYQYLLSYIRLNDSITSKNRLETFTNLALKYGTKEKQTSIELLKIEKNYEIAKNSAQRRTLYILAFGLAIVLLSIYFIVQFYNQRITTTKIITEQKEEINQQKIRELEDNIKISSMRSVIEGQEIERERIAKDLHDSLGGLLSTIKLQFDNVSTKNKELSDTKSYNKAYELLDTAVEEVRTISRNLQPGSLQNLGLIPAIRDLINRFEGEHNPDIDFQYYGIPEKLDRMVSLSIYRIIQELLNNSIKHAQASEILIQLNSEDDEIVIQYEDDGIGFDQYNLKHKGMGLENIKSRVNYMYGTMTMDSESGKGMSVMIRVKYQ